MKFDAFRAALNFHKVMVARGLWEKYADMMRTVVYHANMTMMDKNRATLR